MIHEEQKKLLHTLLHHVIGRGLTVDTLVLDNQLTHVNFRNEILQS